MRCSGKDKGMAGEKKPDATNNYTSVDIDTEYNRHAATAPASGAELSGKVSGDTFTVGLKSDPFGLVALRAYRDAVMSGAPGGGGDMVDKLSPVIRDLETKQ